MKFRLFLRHALLVCFLGSVAHADPIFPLPEYYIAMTAEGGLITDIPDATITKEVDQPWFVYLPAGQDFIASLSSFPYQYVRDPDVPGLLNSIMCINWAGAPLRWVRTREISPPGWEPVDRGLLTLQGRNGPVGMVWLLDPPNGVPDSCSTLSLLVAALLSIAGVARRRLVPG